MKTIGLLKKYWRENYLVFLFIFIIGFLAYFNSLTNGPITDDFSLIAEGKSLEDLDYTFKVPPYYLRTFVYTLLYKTTASVNLVVFHLSNISFHLINSLLVFILFAFIFRKRVGFFTASLFAVHPILTESVTWISGGGYAQFTSFFLLSFLFYVFYAKKASSKPASRVYLYLSIFFYLGSLASNVWAISLFTIFFLYEHLFGDIKKNYKRLALYTLISLAWVMVPLGSLSSRLDYLGSYSRETGLFYNPFFQIPQALGLYIELLVWPKNLSISHNLNPDLNTALFGKYLIVFGYFLLLFYSFRKSKNLFFALAFFLLAIALNLIPLKIFWLVGERYVYLSSIGIFLAVGLLLDYIINKFGFKRWVYAFFLVVVVLLGVRTYYRNLDWKSQESLYQATLKVNPFDPKAHGYLGLVYGSKGEYQQAINEFEKALKVDPKNTELLNLLASTYRSIKNNKLALTVFLASYSVEPNSLVTIQNIVEIYFEEGDYEKAADFAKKEIELRPQNPTLYINLGKIYLKQNKKTQAIENFNKTLELDPQNQAAFKYLQEAHN
ncbi:MAG: tetratricopeptide repeat protein [Candidatus Daviesbacteria bacterium]|nr:tetratricopeptide repeat protein [Candidatus Daviesbacteria bacterium]